MAVLVPFVVYLIVYLWGLVRVLRWHREAKRLLAQSSTKGRTLSTPGDGPLAIPRGGSTPFRVPPPPPPLPLPLIQVYSQALTLTDLVAPSPETLKGIILKGQFQPSRLTLSGSLPPSSAIPSTPSNVFAIYFSTDGATPPPGLHFAAGNPRGLVVHFVPSKYSAARWRRRGTYQPQSHIVAYSSSTPPSLPFSFAQEEFVSDTTEHGSPTKGKQPAMHYLLVPDSPQPDASPGPAPAPSSGDGLVRAAAAIDPSNPLRFRVLLSPNAAPAVPAAASSSAPSPSSLAHNSIELGTITLDSLNGLFSTPNLNPHPKWFHFDSLINALANPSTDLPFTIAWPLLNGPISLPPE